MKRLLVFAVLLVMGAFLAGQARADSWYTDSSQNGLAKTYPSYQECIAKSNLDERYRCETYADAPGNQVPTMTENQIGSTLSQQLYCQAKGVLSGNLGLLVGLIMALFGLYAMVSGSLMGGLIMLILGALITALPSLVESFMIGLGSFLQNSQLGGQGFRPPGC